MQRAFVFEEQALDVPRIQNLAGTHAMVDKSILEFDAVDISSRVLAPQSRPAAAD